MISPGKKGGKTILVKNQLTLYIPDNFITTVNWAQKEYGKNLSRLFVNYLQNLKEKTQTPAEKHTTENLSKETQPENTIQNSTEVETCVKTAFADITNDRTFIADIGRAFAANATRLRYNELKIRHPGCDAQIRAAITKDHAELARLAGLDK